MQIRALLSSTMLIFSSIQSRSVMLCFMSAQAMIGDSTMKRHAVSVAVATLIMSASWATAQDLKTAVDGTFAPHAFPKLSRRRSKRSKPLSHSRLAGTWCVWNDCPLLFCCPLVPLRPSESRELSPISWSVIRLFGIRNRPILGSPPRRGL